MDMKELAGKLVAEVKESAAEYGRLKGFSLGSLRGLIATTKIVVKRVEEEGLSQGLAGADKQAQGLAGADKQALAIEILLIICPLPWYLAPVARAILPPLVDAVVDALKDKFGK